jgi:arylsulfatase A-like enzyme
MSERASGGGGSDHPNVLVVFSDQQRWDTVGAHGSPLSITPNLDAAAEAGTAFDQAITPQPVCAPARACLQTGQYATTNGVTNNGGQLPEVEHTLARVFDRAGYDTGYVGKWHLHDGPLGPVPEGNRGGYDYWRVANVLEHTSHPYEGLVYDEDDDPVRFEEYRVDAMTDMMIDFLERDRDAPFFGMISYLEPHHQNDMETYTAPGGYAHRYRNPWAPEDLRGRPGDWHEELPDYYGICERIDECYGRLLDALRAQSELENTTVLYTSDHGSHFRTRNGEYKRSCHESSIHVPMIARGPGFEDGGHVEDPVSLLDVSPTLVDAAGLDVPDAYQGRSALPVVEGEDGREDVFVQPISGEEIARTLRTDRWTYSVYAPDADSHEPDSYVERYLYDLAADPHQQVNLIGRNDHRDVADRLRERLLDRIAAVEGEVTIERTGDVA